LGIVAGFFPIGWIVLNVIFLYQLTVATGQFELLKRAVGGVTEDRRLQLLLIAFSFGAFFEGASGFGTPVAVTGAVLIGLGFSPLAASGLSLIANTAPVHPAPAARGSRAPPDPAARGAPGSSPFPRGGGGGWDRAVPLVVSGGGGGGGGRGGRGKGVPPPLFPRGGCCPPPPIFCHTP